MADTLVNGISVLTEGAASGTPDEEVYVFPASFGQQRLWFLDQFEPGSPYYNIPAAFRLTGRFSTEVFGRAINEIVRRHESLRTTFAARNGNPVQVIKPASSVDVPVIDLSDLPVEARTSKVMELARAEARRPFDLATGPLMRATVLRLDAQEHVVLVTMHHIVSDGWSIGVLMREITVLYSAFSQGRPSPLQDLSVQYADYAEWQREQLQGENLERQLSYWKNALAGCSDLLELPTDRPRPAVYTNVGATASILVPRATVEALHTLSRQENVTMFMTLLAAFATLLHRYSGQEDLNIGTPIANRTRGETEGLIGLFINTLVLRMQLEGEPTFVDLLKRVREATLGAYSHQDLPFERLVDALQLSRDMSRSPLFQVMFILQNIPARAEELPGVKLEQIEVDMGTSTSDLTLSLAESPRGLHVSAEYNTDLFDPATIRRMLEHYGNILERVARTPGERISRLRVLSPQEEQQLLYTWNDLRAHRPEVCVHELFAAAASRTPEAPAAVFQAKSLTYRELDRAANRLARRLVRLGIGPEVRAGICLEKSLEMIVAVLGVLKAGGAYVPLDPAQPRERLSSMIEDAEMRVLLTHSEIERSLPPFTGTLLCLDRERDDIALESAEAPTADVGPDNLAYMIYTSGTTGKSKGTMITHRSLVNAYAGWEEAYTLTTVARSHLQMANFAFDVFSGDFVRALCSGGKLVVCPREYLLDAERLYELMVSEAVTIAEFVPAVLRNLVQYLDATGKSLAFMRLLIAGSDIWYVREYRDFLRFIGPETRLINSFGLTEATIDSSYFEAADLALPPERLVPIGRPFPNTQIYILDRHLQPTPVGVAGEVCIGGTGLARIYHKRPDLTAEKFVPDPFLKVAGARLYRTGDLGRFLPDGNVEFLGRVDHQVKIRGFRVELGEIETALSRFPGVKEGVAVVREDTPGDRKVIAYVVPAGSTGIQVTELREFLLQKLPDYMVPGAFVTLERLPLTPNGKVDRKALPAPDSVAPDLSTEYVAPRNQVEEILAGIWAALLRVPRVGVFDNFFLLGGHSLLATQLVARIRETFRAEIQLRKVFETPTIAAIAEAVGEGLLKTAGLEAPQIVPAPRHAELPLSYAQQRLWFLDQLEPNSPFYNIPEVYRIQGSLDHTVLSRCINEVVRRHENLRTSFASHDGRPVQVIAPELTVDVPVTDLSMLPDAEREAAALQHARQDAARPIALDRPPLLRARLLRLGAEDHVIVVIIHHIVSDNWSTQVFIREVASLYEAFSRGRPSPLPDLPVQYADYALWQRTWLQGEVMDTQVGYWKNVLSGSPPVLELPTDHPRGPVQTFNGAFRSFTLSAELTRRIRDLGVRENATMFMTLLAAFKMLLYRYTAQTDISIGTPIANRTRAEIEGLIGFFVNTLVLRTDLSGNPSFRDLLGRVRSVALGAYAHQDAPFEKLVDVLQPHRDLSHSPLFQVMFTLQSAPAQPAQLSTLTISPLEIHSGTSKFDLTLFMVDGGESLGGAIEFNTDLFDTDTIDRMAGHFERLLCAAVDAPDAPVARLPMLADDEAARAFVEWNGRTQPSADRRPVHGRFEAQAARTPDAVAIEFRDVRLTYAEVNRRANRLARTLIGMGAGPGMNVGVMVERSPELIVALLGCLKSGAAYVPFDPDYPGERLSYMAGDAGIGVLVTRRDLAARLEHHPARLLLVEEWDGGAEGDCPEPAVEVTPADLAYMIYTSGSTGRPKGTMITHGGLSNYLDWCLATYPYREGCGSVVHSTIAFDATVTAVFPTLLAGRHIRLIPEGEEIEGLAAELRGAHDYSVVKITPAHLELLGRQLTPEEAKGAVRAFVIGGENLTPDHIRFWQAHAPDTKLYNEYGPTETVVGCVVYEVPPGYAGRSSVLIGRAIPNTSAYVLDEFLQPVAAGVAGELYIGGAGVARGYAGRPELTAERFVPDPYGHEPGSRLYRTGDRVRYLANGQMEFLGRLDEQVKVRGYRIEPGEIEAVLGRHQDILESVVVACGDRSEDRRLVAYVVPRDGQMPPVADMRAFLARQLPDYMIPAAFVCLDSLPLTPNGKVDRRALPEPDADMAVARTVYVAPRTPEEEIIAGIWSEVLSLSRVGAHDNFFDLGGHSLLATQVMSRLRSALDVEVPLRVLFEAPTVAELAAELARARREASADRVGGIVPVDRTGDLPLSFAQQRLWFLDQLEPGSALYNIPMAFRLVGQLNEKALERSVNEIVRRHEVLRTSFETVDGMPRQKIAAELPVSIEQLDLAHLGADEQMSAVRSRVADEFATPFDLGRAPLFRIKLLRLAERDRVIIITMHHVISDDWSTGILIREMGALYQACLEGRESPLPPLRVQYADYAAWQRAWLSGGVLERQLAYWKARMAGAPDALELPADHPRPPVRSGRAGMEKFELPPAIVTGTRELSRLEGTTVFMTLLAAFQVLLARYTGQHDVSVGTPVANRTRGETEELIGFFVNTLVLRTDLGGGASFREVLRRVRDAALEAYAHQDLPFEMLVEALDPDRNTGQSPLFQVMFSFQTSRKHAGTLADLELAPLDADTPVARFDLALSMAESPLGIHGAFEYSADLFETASVRRMRDHLLALLAGALGEPDRAIDDLPMLSDSERQEILGSWNNTAACYPSDACIHELVERVAAENPESPALISAGTTLSYRDLDRRASQLARHLIALGCKRGDRIAVVMDHSPELVISMLGILKAGMAYVPLDPAVPRDRLHYSLRDGSVRVVLTSGELIATLTGTGCRVLAVDADWESIAAEPAEPLRAECSADDLAYVIYTSGTTGEPKGVMLGHRGLVNLVTAQTAGFGIQPCDRVLQFASPGFDASVSEMFMALTTGATLVQAERDRRASPEDLPRMMREMAVTVVTLPPTMLGAITSNDVPSLRVLISAGESCAPDLAREWSRGRTFFNAYGPTETTIGPTYFAVAGLVDGAATVPIGRPISNMRVYIVDPGLRPVPVGVRGEILIGGPGVAWGYLNRPALTAEKFVPDPFAVQPGGRLYRTGDVGRFLQDGSVEFIGRLDDQVKLRGFRVELGEVEATLRRHPAVRETVAALKPDRRGGMRLVAYVAAREGEAPDTGALRQFLREALPEHMVPSAFVVLERLPRTASGKLDRRALPEPAGQERGTRSLYVAPRTATEEMLVSLWQEILGLESVGVHESFFDLGGHSLLAAQVVSRVRKIFGVEVPLRSIFEHPTVATLARTIEEVRGAGAAPAAGPIRPAARDGEIPLSYAQLRLWFLDQLEPESPAYNVPLAFRLRGPLDPTVLGRSLNEVVRRHETLRTVFPVRGGKAVQEILEARELQLPVVDLEALGEEERERRARELALTEAQRPFNLQTGPLVRAQLLRLGPEDHVAVVTMHHICTDGWSMGVLTEELVALYEAFTRGEPSPLPELQIQYADYAAWQREWLRGEVLDQQVSYWQEQLRDAPQVIDLPTDRPRPSSPAYEGAEVHFDVPGPAARRLLDICRQEGVTPYMALLGAFQALLSRYVRQTDICVGTPTANRSREDIEGLIGFFVNTLVMRTDLSGAPTFRETVRRVRNVTLGAFAHQDLPFEMLVDLLHPERSMGHSPLFQVMFVFQNTVARPRRLAGLSIEPLDSSTGVAKFDLTLVMARTPEGFTGTLEYNATLFDRSTIERMSRHLVNLLDSATSHPEEAVAGIDFLTPGERTRALGEWARPAAAEAPELCVHQLVEAQSQRSPESVAIAYGGIQISYRELVRRAGNVGRYLRTHGVETGDIVGICLERPPERIVAMLGVLCSGAAFLPLDPEHPVERIRFMLEDASCRLVLTESHLRDSCSETCAEVVSVDEDWAAMQAVEECAPLPLLQADSLAYVIYTSGSTGRPKGVLLGHRGLSSYIRANAESCGINETSRMLQFASPNFDASVSEIFTALTSGAALHLADRSRLRSLPDLHALMREERITSAILPPTLLQALPEDGLEHLEVLMSAGEACPVDVARRWSRGRRFFNGYGPTEATVGPTIHAVHELPESATTVPIGRPIGGISVYVLDDHLQLMPPGTVGEICIGGVGVAWGYVNRPDLTAQCFVPDPFGEEPGARLYRSGDLGRHRSDGVLEIAGRADEQVKIRGFRIEPGEIESALAEHPAVLHAAVVARGGRSGENHLTAYIVWKHMPGPTAEDVRAFLRERMPDYMIPSVFVTLDSMPLSTSGKVDRRSLPDSEEGRIGVSSTYVAPETDRQKILAGIWQDLLSLERVGIHDNFFDLGGDSILSIQMVARAKEEGISVTPRQLFENPTIEALARVSAGRPVAAASSIAATGRVMPTPAQRQFFSHYSNRSRFNTSMLLEVDVPLDEDRLRSAVTLLVEHHDALRMRARSAEGEPDLEVSDEVPDAIVAFRNLATVPRRRLREEIERTALNVQGGFDLARGPLLRVVYMKCGANLPGRLLIVFHHLVTDVYSWRMFLQDLQSVYAQLTSGRTPVLPEKSASYREWSIRLNEYAGSPEARREESYWSRILKESLTPIPIDYPDGTNTYGESAHVTVALDEQDTSRLLRDVPGQRGIQAQAVLLAALVRTLEPWTGDRRLLVQMNGHGREDLFEGVDISRTMGWFTCTYPLLLDLRAAGDVIQETELVARQIAGTPRHGMGYGILRWLSPDPAVRARMKDIPQPEVNFNFLGQFPGPAPEDRLPLRLAREPVGAEQDPAENRECRLYLVATAAGNRLGVRWLYSTGLHKRSTIQRLARSYLRNVHLVLKHLLRESGTER